MASKYTPAWMTPEGIAKKAEEQKKPSPADEQKAAIEEMNKAYEDFIAAGPVNYQTGQPLSFEEFIAGSPLGLQSYERGKDIAYQTLPPEELAKLGASRMDGITTDSRLVDAEFDALRSLEERSKEGLTLQDEADMARLQSDVNRRNRGRMGAIQQNMQARGMSGSGLDLLAQMQASQDATEMEALASLEKAAQSQNNKRAAAMDLGSMASRQRGQQFEEQAAKARAADEIARFNTANMVNLQNKNVDTGNRAIEQNWTRTNETNDRNTGVRNTEATQNWERLNQTNDRNTAGRNDTAAQNWQRSNATSDRNTAADAAFRADKLGAQTAQGQNKYNYSVDRENFEKMQEMQREQRKAGKTGAIGGIAGAVAGSYFGPAGAAAGYQIGSGLGQGISYYAHGGKVDSIENDTVPAMLSPGEVVIPRSIADDPVKSSEFVAEANGDEMDAVGHLLAAMQLMNKRK